MRGPQPVAVVTPAGGERGQDLVVTLRDGSEHVLVLDEGTDVGHVLDEVSAGRSQLFRGWVTVRPPTGSTRAVVSGDEIIRLRVVDGRP